GDGSYGIDPESMGRRAFKNVCLGTLAALDGRSEVDALVDRQFAEGGNMTDVLAALANLNDSDRPERAAALDAFYETWQGDPLVIDKWFALQAMSHLPGTLAAIKELMRHPAYDRRNPNRVRSVVAAFATGNPLHFHAADGGGYAFLADAVIAIDPMNPQLAARLVTPLGRWRRQDEGRQTLMKAALERILSTPELSKDVFEIASKSVA
ncbi:MAG TPA: aminopeptidase N C-terminal domain-containing protein, partial [Alphaproteobacteria bacterium]|nr:aminopeptidase N C-terminal domain-containing protein [Alphaproteobacteria bacterium]